MFLTRRFKQRVALTWKLAKFKAAKERLLERYSMYCWCPCCGVIQYDQSGISFYREVKAMQDRGPIDSLTCIGCNETTYYIDTGFMGCRTEVNLETLEKVERPEKMAGRFHIPIDDVLETLGNWKSEAVKHFIKELFR